MAVYYNEEKKLFQLDTVNTSYIIGLSPEGYVGHVYYGERLCHGAEAYLLRMEEHPYTPSVLPAEKTSFLDIFPTEYPTGGMGDFRESCLDVRSSEGCVGCELLYREYHIIRGKKALKGLPASFEGEEPVDMLEILCRDEVLGLEVTLSYTTFEKEDVITRNILVKNLGQQELMLEKAYSACLDMDNEDYEMLTLCGAWARERQIQRVKLHYGKQAVSSARSISSHQEHPFLALVSPETTQTQGRVYAMHFVYSGSFLAQAELSQYDMVRVTMGIHRDSFGWRLAPGGEFQTPEVVLTFSGQGLGKMTANFHDFYREHMIRSPYRKKERPILINNWEATYFDFDTEKLLSIAREAVKHGIEMLVMDDGWYGKRNNTDSSLGDWKVNTKKLPGGLEYLVGEVNRLGMKFGIWMEPEMISPDSDLYRKHPEWAIQLPGRGAALCRGQYVLDLSRPEVREYVYQSIASVLRSAHIEYLKWDMNRPLCDLGSTWLPAEGQRELSHRYVLGLYELQERLLTEFPDLLLENCSAGGGRFDPGMLYYSPQIWCSDNTDAIERLTIQEGTALIYPLSCIGAHVSACPNHSVGRVTPFATRGDVALVGTFGYELDITKLGEEDLSMVQEQTELYHKYYSLVREGDYHRIASYSTNHLFDCWTIAAKDGSEVLMTYVQVLGRANVHSRKIRLTGFDPDGVYRLEGTEETYTGEMLMKAGFLIRDLWGDFQSRLYHFVRG